MAELVHMFGVSGLVVIFATAMAMIGRFAWHQRQQVHHDHDVISRTGFTLTVLRGGGGKSYFPHPCGGGYSPRRPDDDPDDAA